MALNGIDVSTWQPANITNLVNYDFAIMKASEGSMVAKNCNAQVQHARRRGKLFGTYHFAVPGSPKAQADFYVKTVEGYVGEGILVLDLEGSGLTAWGGGGAFEFMDRVRDLTGVSPLFYSFGSALSGNDMRQLVEADFGLWTAHWNNRTTGGYSTPPKPMTGKWPFAAIHQYTDRGHLRGYSGDLDLNIFHGDAATWRSYATGNKKEEEDMPLNDSDIQKIRKNVDDVVWGRTFKELNPGTDYGMPEESAAMRLRRAADRSGRAMVIGRRNAAEIQALRGAFETLADNAGLPGDQILAKIDAKLAEAFKDFSITMSVDSEESPEA